MPIPVNFKRNAATETIPVDITSAKYAGNKEAISLFNICSNDFTFFNFV